MPPDRVFGRIEQTLRKHETVMLPSEYDNVSAEYATVRALGTDWNIFDYKTAVGTMVKKKQDFPLTKARVLQVTSKAIGMKETFSGDFCTHSILKRGCKIDRLKPTAVGLHCHVKVPKAKDVKMLLEKMGVNLELSSSLSSFYSPVLELAGRSNNAKDDSAESDIDDETDCDCI
jgi:hypothetical protein